MNWVNLTPLVQNAFFSVDRGLNEQHRVGVKNILT